MMFTYYPKLKLNKLIALNCQLITLNCDKLNAMKKLYTVLLATLFSFSVLAQSNHQVELQTGLNIPTSDYAESSVINAQTGFAKIGSYTSASYSPLFGSILIPKAQVFYGYNPFDETAFFNRIGAKYVDNPNLQVSNFNAYSYSYLGLAVGPGFKTRGERFYVRMNLMFAFVRQSHPELRTEGVDISDMKDWSDVLVQTSHNSYGAMLELGFYKHLTDRLFLSLNTSVFGSPFDFNQDGSFEKAGEQAESYQNPRQGEIDNVNVTVGVSYLLKEPKAKIHIF